MSTTRADRTKLGYCDLLLTGGVVVTVDDDFTVFDTGAVAIVDDRIADVGHQSEFASVDATRTVDCSGKLVMPGLVDCHNHLFNSLSRGLGEGLGLWQWLSDFKWPYNATINPDEAVAAVRLSALESVRAGTTSVLDHHYGCADVETTLAVAEAVEQVGLRGRVGRGMVGPITEEATAQGLGEELFRYTIDEELEMMRACLESRPRGGLVEVCPAPLDIIYTPFELIVGAVALADEFGTGWHAHCSEVREDPELFRQAHGLRPVSWLYREGLLTGATLAHTIWLDDAEIEELGETQTGVAHNPVCNMYLSSAPIRLNDLRAAGARVGLGTDSANVGHRQDLFEQMKQSILLQRVHTMDASVMDARSAVELATRGGAEYLGIEAGVLKEGKLADVIVVDMSGPHTQPVNDIPAAIAYSASGRDVTMTIVGGSVVYEDGQSTTVSDEDIIEEARSRAHELLTRAGLPHAGHRFPAQKPSEQSARRIPT